MKPKMTCSKALHLKYNVLLALSLRNPDSVQAKTWVDRKSSAAPPTLKVDTDVASVRWLSTARMARKAVMTGVQTRKGPVRKLGRTAEMPCRATHDNKQTCARAPGPSTKAGWMVTRSRFSSLASFLAAFSASV